jgi:hypothetical protein
MEGSGKVEEKRNAAMLLKGVDLSEACLQKAILNGANLNGANLAKVRLEKATLIGASIKHVFLEWANLRKTDLSWANLEGSDLTGAHLERAFLFKTCLKDVCLFGAHLEGANLEKAHLELSELNNVFLEDTYLYSTFLADKNSIGPRMADMHWGEVNLTILDWERVKMLGDEYRAEEKLSDGEPKSKSTRLDEYKEAVRAYRQLATVLRSQGLNEDAVRFAYRAQLMQRKVFWYQRKFVQYFGSLFLDLLSGYGYKPLRSFITYVVVISVFALIYFLLGPHLAWNEAIVISMTAFHGRGFFPNQFQPGDPQALVAALEAFVGLLIEVTFIATLTQRLFGK